MKALLDRENLTFNPPPLGCVLSLSELPGSGSKIYDRSPYGNIGSIVGATWKRQPSGLWYLDFDGADDYVDCGSGVSLNITGSQASIEVIFCLDAIPGTQWLAGNDNDSGASVGGYSLNLYNSKLRGFIRRASNSVILSASGSTILQSDTWYFGAMVFNGTSVIVYLNGVQDGISSTITLDTIEPASNTFKLGALPVAVGWWKLDGSIAFIRIYDRALSAVEIQNHFNRKKHLFGAW